MKKGILCGSSCIKYILNKYHKLNLDLLNKNMIWITELAVFLKRSGIEKIKINCYNSNLYNDFKNKNIDLNFDGFKNLNDAINENILITEKRLTNNSLSKEIDENDYLILCVESKIFNDDNSMSGGHYIILCEHNDRFVKIVNPIKDKYEEKVVDIDFLVNSAKNYGSWRILINKEEN